MLHMDMDQGGGSGYNIATCMPGGVVCFHENLLYSTWVLYSNIVGV